MPISPDLQEVLDNGYGLAYDDLTAAPKNNIEEDILALINGTKAQKHEALIQANGNAIKALHDLKVDGCLPNTQRVRDLQRKVRETTQARSDFMSEMAKRLGLDRVDSRELLDVTPPSRYGHIGIEISNMNSVVGPTRHALGTNMAIEAAIIGLQGAAITQDLKDDALQEMTKELREADPMFGRNRHVPVTTTVRQLREQFLQTGVPGAVVTGENGQLLGVIRNPNDYMNREWEGYEVPFTEHNDDDSIESLINEETPKLKYNAALREKIYEIEERSKKTGENPHHLMQAEARKAIRLMKAGEGTTFLPIVNESDQVMGMWTLYEAAFTLGNRPHISPTRHRGLAITATIGVNRSDVVKDALRRVALGADRLILDTAHFDNATQFLDALKAVREAVGWGINIVAGNVLPGKYNTFTPSIVRKILLYADVVKVGVAPGWACTTNLVAAHGAFQASGLWYAGQEAIEMGGFAMADGGMGFYPRSLVLANAMPGVDGGMYASKLACTHPSFAEIFIENGIMYARHTGMASEESALARMGEINWTSPELSDRQMIESILWPRAEGATLLRRAPQNARLMNPRAQWLNEKRGIQSAMSYAGVRKNTPGNHLEAFKRRVYLKRLSPNARGLGSPNY